MPRLARTVFPGVPYHVTQRGNRREDVFFTDEGRRAYLEWKGHLWQGRFFSSALDEPYLLAALRYVERNPVRARIVRKAETYLWSSAAAHCGLREDGTLTDDRYRLTQIESVGDWSKWLAEGDRPDEIEVLRRHVERGLPCGSEKFVRKPATTDPMM